MFLKIPQGFLLLAITGALFSASARAEIGVGAIGSFHASDTYTLSSATPNETLKAKPSYALGVLFYLPLMPELSTRVGVEYEKLQIDDSIVGTTHVTWESVLIPLDVQFDLPLTDVYIFGGLIFAENYNRPRLEPGWTDLRLNAGVGYSFIDLGPAKLSFEAEYMAGTQNLSPVPGNSLKTRALLLSLQARMTL